MIFKVFYPWYQRLNKKDNKWKSTLHMKLKEINSSPSSAVSYLVNHQTHFFFWGLKMGQGDGKGKDLWGVYTQKFSEAIPGSVLMGPCFRCWGSNQDLLHTQQKTHTTLLIISQALLFLLISLGQFPQA